MSTRGAGRRRHRRSRCDPTADQARPLRATPSAAPAWRASVTRLDAVARASGGSAFVGPTLAGVNTNGRDRPNSTRPGISHQTTSRRAVAAIHASPAIVMREAGIHQRPGTPLVGRPAGAQ